jgi:hypothetical protein
MYFSNTDDMENYVDSVRGRPAVPVLRLYLLTQTEVQGYDTYDGAVVCAESEEAARLIHPRADGKEPNIDPWEVDDGHVWPRDPAQVKVWPLGVAEPSTTRGVVLASFNAG